MGTAPHARTLEQLLKSGIAVIDKPCGPSSHEVSSFVRKILHAEKTGHAGTLDPNVSGILPVLLGEACKLTPMLSRSKKSYVCLMRMGDAVPFAELDAALENFRGKIYQKPPLQSAVAKRLRIREIHSLSLLEVEGKHALFEAECEAGTYIRNVCRDVGEVLGCGCEMEELRRTTAIDFSEKDAITLQQLSDYYWLKTRGDETRLKAALVPIERAVKLKKITLADDGTKRALAGAPVRTEDLLEVQGEIALGEEVSVHTGRGQMFAIAKSLHEKLPEKGMAFAIQRVLKVL